MSDIAYRLLAALRRDPHLAWEVASHIKVAGPWEAVGDDWFQRTDTTCTNIATVRIEAYSRQSDVVEGWLWDHFRPQTTEDPVSSGRVLFQNSEDARAACDAYLLEQGWILLDAPPPPKKVEGLRARVIALLSPNG